MLGTRGHSFNLSAFIKQPHTRAFILIIVVQHVTSSVVSSKGHMEGVKKPLLDSCSCWTRCHLAGKHMKLESILYTLRLPKHTWQHRHQNGL